MAFSKLDALASVAELMGSKKTQLLKARRREVGRTAYDTNQTDHIEAAVYPSQLVEANQGTVTMEPRPIFSLSFPAPRKFMRLNSFTDASCDAAQRELNASSSFSEPAACTQNQSAPLKRSPPFSGPPFLDGSVAPEASGAWALPAAKRRNTGSAGGLWAAQMYDIQLGPSRMAVDESYDFLQPARPQPLDETLMKSNPPNPGGPPRWSTGLGQPAGAAGPDAAGSHRLRASSGRLSPGISAASDEPCNSSHIINVNSTALPGRNRTSAGSQPLPAPPQPQPQPQPGYQHEAAPQPAAEAEAGQAAEELAATGAGPNMASSPPSGGTTRARRRFRSTAAAAAAVAAATSSPPAEASTPAATAAAIATTTPAAAAGAAADGGGGPLPGDVGLCGSAAACLSILARSPSKGGPDLLEKMRIAETLLTHRDKLGPQLVQLVIQQLAALCQSASVDELVARMASQQQQQQQEAGPDAPGSGGLSRSNSGSHSREQRVVRPEEHAATGATGTPCGPESLQVVNVPAEVAAARVRSAAAATAGAAAAAAAADPVAAARAVNDDDDEERRGGSTSSSSSSSRTATHGTEPRGAAAAATTTTTTGSAPTGPKARSPAATAAPRATPSAAAATSLDLPAACCPVQASPARPGYTELPMKAAAPVGRTAAGLLGGWYDAAAAADVGAPPAPPPPPLQAGVPAAPRARGGSMHLDGPLHPSLLPRHLQQRLRHVTHLRMTTALQGQGQEQELEQPSQFRLHAAGGCMGPGLGMGLGMDVDAAERAPLRGGQWAAGGAGGEVSDIDEHGYGGSGGATAAAPPRRRAVGAAERQAAPAADGGGAVASAGFVVSPAAAQQQQLLELGRELARRGELPPNAESVMDRTGTGGSGGGPSATTAALIAALAQRARSIAGMRPTDVGSLAAALAQRQQQQQQQQGGGPSLRGQLRAAAGGVAAAEPPPAQMRRWVPVPHSGEEEGGEGALDWEAGRDPSAGDLDTAPLHLQQQQQHQAPGCIPGAGDPRSTARRAFAAALAARAAGPGGGFAAWGGAGDGEESVVDARAPVTAAAVATTRVQRAPAAAASAATSAAQALPARAVAGVRDSSGLPPGWSAAAAAVATRGLSDSRLADARRCIGGSGGPPLSLQLPLSPDAYVTIHLSESLPAAAAAATAGKAMAPAAYGVS